MSTPQAGYQPGQSFPLQLAWRLPDGGYLRAVFRAEVLELVDSASKYVVRLASLEAGREEDAGGGALPAEQISRAYWDLVGGLIGRTITIAYEADDGHAIYLRLETLTGEHNFFTRYEDAEVIARGIRAQRARLDDAEDTAP